MMSLAGAAGPIGHSLEGLMHPSQTGPAPFRLPAFDKKFVHLPSFVLRGDRLYIHIVMLAITETPGRGRPREFCADTALAAALKVFWAKGYDGASMAELTAAMGIAKPSLYAAFGNKEQLFGRALDLYEREKLAYVREAISQPTARTVAEHIMSGAIAAQTSSHDPKGCLGVIGAMPCGVEAESIKAEVLKRRQSSTATLIERFAQARRDGDLPSHVEPEALARYLITILQGMAVQASGGATCEDLRRVVETSMSMWPSP